MTFVGRIQPLKAPDILVRAAAPLIHRGLAGGRKLRVLIAGGPSGSGLQRPTSLIELARELGVEASVTFIPPQSPERLAGVYRASDLVAVPSYSESFGLVAIEAQAVGVPVIAADVGGLGVAVDDGVTGVLVSGHDVDHWTARTRSAARRSGAADPDGCGRPRPCTEVLVGPHRGPVARQLQPSHRHLPWAVSVGATGRRGRCRHRRPAAFPDCPPLCRTTKWSARMTADVTAT